MDEKPYVIVDCSGDTDAPVSVWNYEFTVPSRAVFASIGDMFSFALLASARDAAGSTTTAKPLTLTLLR
ncbi:MAG: hypothetical protein JWQ18_3301 [Conexibacter sp.]|nr:hypothetical protein [Conexibacter sp.]